MKLYVIKHKETGKYWNGRPESVVCQPGNHLLNRDSSGIEFWTERSDAEAALHHPTLKNMSQFAFYCTFRPEEYKVVRWKGNLAQDLILRKLWAYKTNGRI